MEQLQELAKSKVVFDIVKSHGCLVGHSAGEQFIFPSGGGLGAFIVKDLIHPTAVCVTLVTFLHANRVIVPFS